MHQAFLVCLIWRLYIHANRLFFRSFESFERIFMKNCTSLMTFKQTSNVNLGESNACRFSFYVVTVSGFLIRNKLKMVWRCCYKLSVMFIITKQVESLVMYKLQMIASCTTWSFVAFFSHHKQNEEVFFTSLERHVCEWHHTIYWLVQVFFLSLGSSHDWVTQLC